MSATFEMEKLHLDNIKGGQVISNLNELIEHVSQLVYKNHIQFGMENGHSASAEVNLSIKIEKNKQTTADGIFNVATKLSYKVPKIPEAMGQAYFQDGEMLVDNRGCDNNNPLQMSTFKDMEEEKE